MPASDTTAATEAATHAWLPWALGLIVGVDYFDSAVFSFFASYIAGGINAAPDELVWASSAYAVTAVLGILQQGAWVERLGYRRYLAASMLLYAAGATAAALSDNAVELLLARAAQGYCVGPMLGACRILVQIAFTPQQRSNALRTFLGCLIVCSASAPIIGAFLVAHFDWRALFGCTAPAAVGIALWVLRVVPDQRDAGSGPRGEPRVVAYLVFAFAQAALQIVFTQLRFELFSGSPLLVLLSAAAIGALAVFAYHQWHHPAPFVRLHALRERAFQVGLLLYVFYYFLSTGFSYLLPRLLEGGLGFTVENAGYLTGTTSLIAALGLFAYFRYARLVPRKKWAFIVPGFAIAAVASSWMAHMSPAAGQAALLGPLLLRGLLLLFIVVPVANLTFRLFAVEEFTHGYRLKNLVRQLAISFATASIITLEQHRLALHQTRLAEAANPYNPVFVQTMDALTQRFAAAGHSVAEAQSMALATVAQWVSQQAGFMASLDGFDVLAIVAVIGGAIAAWQRSID